MTVGTCAKCGCLAQVTVDEFGRAFVERHRTVGLADCSGSGAPPRGYLPIKET